MQGLVLAKEHYRALARLEGNGVIITKLVKQRGEQQLQNSRKGSPLLSPSSALLKYSLHRSFHWISLFLFIGCGNSFSSQFFSASSQVPRGGSHLQLQDVSTLAGCIPCTQEDYIIYMFRSFYGFAQSIKCAAHSKNV